MEKRILENLNIDEEYPLNSLIHYNGVIYSKYIAKPHNAVSNDNKHTAKKTNSYLLNKNISEEEISSILAQYTPSQIIGQSPFIEGCFLYDSSKLNSQLFKYGKKIFKMLTINEIKTYINRLNDCKGLSFHNIFGDLNPDILKIIISFFNEFGFPFNNKNGLKNDFAQNAFQYDLIETKLIPSLLVIYIIDSIYTNIVFLETKNLFDYDLDFVNKIVLELFSLENLFYQDLKKIELDLTIDLTQIDYKKFKLKLDYQLFSYKMNLIEIVNQFNYKFLSPKWYTFYSYEEDKNISIPLSDNLLDLSWFVCQNKILTNFKIGKQKICRSCNSTFISKTDDVYCKNCRPQITNVDNQNITKNNKKQFILQLLNKYEKYIFDNTSINQKLAKLKLLQKHNKLDNIDNHNWRITKDLKPLEEQIEVEILNGRYTIKKVAL